MFVTNEVLARRLAQAARHNSIAGSGGSDSGETRVIASRGREHKLFVRRNWLTSSTL